ncbi:MAG: thiolase family protein [Candidatus Eremiobacteraeota bacterium]|nr:thiolase family protein [Candidatus Eremiobacteraeota bacterium]
MPPPTDERKTLSGNYSQEIVIVAGARTPFGNFNGALSQLSATDLATHAAEAAIRRSGVPADKIDDIVFGNVMQTSADAIYLARHVGLRCGIPIETPALTLNRLCGSGLQAILTAANSLLLGQSTYALAGGAESMSQAPHVIRGARKGLALGAGKLEDSLWEALTDSYNGLPMAITAENLAQRYKISREACDEFALRSQENAVAAQENGYFSEEIEAVTAPGPKGAQKTIDRDEGPRAGLTMERLSSLPARFTKDGVVTPGNASGITDGAAAVVMTTRERAQADGIEWLGTLVTGSVVGVDPDIMGIGPAYAIPRALKRADLAQNELNVIEINEAFAPQVLACLEAMSPSILERAQKSGELGIRLNPHGGAISLGHPLGASGARLALTTLHDLRKNGGGYGIASACIGGGQGIAAIFSAN